MITALCGGVGGSKLAQGMYRVLTPDSLTVIVNTADDLEFCGLRVSPDCDTVMYTLAGLSRPDVGWGIEGDTFQALRMLGSYGLPTWFQVGDRDLATSLFRTSELRRGTSLGAVTASMAAALGVQARILPMSEDAVSTRLLVGESWLEFQQYFVERRHSDPVDAVRYDGIEEARPTEEVITTLSEAEIIVLVNSNPVLSILPILSLPGVRAALKAASAPCVAVSPIIGSDAVSGPAGRLMRLAGHEARATGIAHIYADLLDGLVIDRKDEDQTETIERLGIRVLCTDILMNSHGDRTRLAEEVLRFAGSLG